MTRRSYLGIGMNKLTHIGRIRIPKGKDNTEGILRAIEGALRD